jgi:uncharacterized LabA/DUF88 family protein
MDLIGLKTNSYLFDPKEFGRIFIFVDFSNVRPWAKDFWPEENKFKICQEIGIKELAELCDLIKPEKKFFYYGHFPKDEGLSENDPKNERYRSSVFRIDKARKSGFTPRSKEVKMIPTYDETGTYLGKHPKCNFDVEIALDVITKIDKYDTIVLFSGDSDFGKLLGYLKSKGKRVVVVSTRNRMSTELETVADKFIPAEKLKNLLLYRNKNYTPPFRAEV